MTKTEILEAAAQIFSEKGFHAASMADIAKAVDLKKASLYHHVSSKQEILFEILEISIDLVISNVLEVLDLDIPVEEKLRKAMVIYFQLLSKYKDQSTVLLLEYRSLSPEYKSEHIKNRDAFESIWRSLIQEGITRNEFECQHPGLTAKDILGMMNWSIMWFNPKGSLTPKEIAEHCADAYLIGLRKK